MIKKQETASELIESHKPKNFKYRFIINDDSFYKELEEQQYDLNNLDTIHNDELVHAALQAEYTKYENSIVGKSKEPTELENGIVIYRKMFTKVGKRLNGIGLAFFTFQETRYMCLRMYYERFDIIELFILT